MSNTKKPFQDHSIFNGIYQYYDDAGIEWRMEDDGAIYKYYKQADEDGCFIYMGAIRAQEELSLKECHFLMTEKLN